MATRAVAVAERPRGGVIRKMNNVQGQGKRRVLGDIGNQIAAPVVVEGKIQNHITRPTTRGYCAQIILAKSKSEAMKPAVVRKPHDHQKLQNVINISSDKEEMIEISSDEEEKPGAARKSKAIGSGKDTKTLTSVLTARSKAACGLPTNPKEAAITNIDTVDADNELAVVEYVDDIYEFYKQTENVGRVGDYMDSQPEITAKMRSILMDWLVEVHRKFELMPETLYLTIYIVDKFLSMKNVLRRELQLVGISSMLIASKYEEIWAPEVSDLIAISDNAYVREQILVMEKAILAELQWYLTVPTPYVFLVRYIKASVPFDKEMEKMVFFIAELALMHYPTVVLFCPSMLAAAAVFTARCTLKKSPSWTETLKHYTGYSEDQLKDCAKMLEGLRSEAAGSNLKAVYRKFSRQPGKF